MNYTFKMIRRVAGKNIKSLYLPIVLSCVDACFTWVCSAQ